VVSPPQFVSEGGLELAIGPCRSVLWNAGLPSVGAGFDDSTFWSVPSRTVPYQPVFGTLADKLMTSTGFAGRRHRPIQDTTDCIPNYGCLRPSRLVAPSSGVRFVGFPRGFHDLTGKASTG
jgi:hypothetical protein